MQNKNKIKLCTILFFIITFNLFIINISAYSSDKNSSNLKITNEAPVLPNITGKTALTIDLSSGDIIYSKNANKQIYPASITKLMTALLFAENAKPTDIIPVTESSKAQPASSLDKNFGPVEIGDSLSGEEVMDALLLYSANDSAYMIADFVSKNSTDFIALMNEKAKNLGMNDTKFVTANGLHDENHYTTPFDLALLGKAAYANTWIKRTLAKKNSTVEFDKSKKRIIIYTTNKDLGKDGNIGAKTGFTSEAGRCLLSIYEREGRKILGIVLDSEHGVDDTVVFNDMKTIINYSFSAKKEIFKKSGEVLDKIDMKYKAFGFLGKENSITIPIILKEDIYYYNNSYNNKLSEIKLDLTSKTPWQLATSKNLKAKFKDSYNNSEYLIEADISLFSLIFQNFLYYLITIGGIILLVTLIIFTISRRKKAKRRSALFNRRKTIFK